jgi:hypothetical protein
MAHAFISMFDHPLFRVQPIAIDRPALRALPDGLSAAIFVNTADRQCLTS